MRTDDTFGHSASKNTLQLYVARLRIEGASHFAKRAIQTSAQVLNCREDGDGYSCCYQTIFDSRRSRLVPPKARDKRVHFFLLYYKQDDTCSLSKIASNYEYSDK